MKLTPDIDLQDVPRPPALSIENTHGLPQRIIQILPEAKAHAQAQVPELNTRLAVIKDKMQKRLEATQRDGISRRGAIDVLRQAADMFNKAALPATGCANQACSHCCYIPVLISQVEADLIGEAIGRKPVRIRHGQEFSREFGYHRPCSFLKGGRCSIYAHRPFTCRIHLNLDKSDRLCELIPDTTVPVMLVDVFQLQVLYAAATADAPLADVRDFFPVQSNGK